MHHSHQYPLPCLYCHPHSYIRMVQNLIERCMLFHMSQEQCIRALAEHAGIKPLVTVTGHYLHLICLRSEALKTEESSTCLCYTWCFLDGLIVWIKLCYFVQCGKSCKRRTGNSLENICRLSLPDHP
ncbi:hypothetical protein VIGAN_01241100 [Vigna angularis var. angularis]|uniref:Uncharacterized protein n=1 Tax=Vigna angularis var. angularis TaxID=157739 RepID=A0A0S3R2E2_PHAAN|nr:hypothetical protein VIGAN_01241100 [Vigna angularis var. angularis]